MAEPALLAFLVLVSAAGLTACMVSGDGASDGQPGNAATLVACNPLAPKPIKLGAILGVGQDTDETLYVDAANGVFVSDGDELVRQHVTGSGQSGVESIFSFEPAGDPAHARSLLVEADSSGLAHAMGLGPAGSRAFLNEPDSGATPLVLVGSATVARLPVVNTPNEISYVGDVENGEVVFATVPLNADDTAVAAGLSIFYGAPDNLIERTISEFQQSLSGNGTVTFLVGSDEYVLSFGTVNPSDSHPLGEFALEGLAPGSGAELDVALRSPTPAETPSGLSFRCLR